MCRGSVCSSTSQHHQPRKRSMRSARSTRPSAYGEGPHFQIACTKTWVTPGHRGTRASQMMTCITGEIRWPGVNAENTISFAQESQGGGGHGPEDAGLEFGKIGIRYRMQGRATLEGSPVC